MSEETGPVRWGPNGAIVGGEFYVVREDGPVKWGHNGDGVVEIMEFDDKKLSAQFRQVEIDDRFIAAHFDEWLERYPDMYVAVYKEELVAVAPNSTELVKKIEAKGIRPGVARWRFLPSEPFNLMLPG